MLYSGEVASDVRDVLLQPLLTHKYENLKAFLIERRGLTTPERVNKVISGEKLGSDIPSRFLRRLQKTAVFGTKAVVGKAGSESGKLVGLLEDLSRRLKKIETATTKATQKKTYGCSQANENRAAKTQFVPNVQAKPFVPNNQTVTRQDV